MVKAPYNRILSVKDYEKGMKNRKDWEVMMALATLKRFGSKPMKVLGIGAGHEPTIYHLADAANEVHATDLYADPGAWEREAPADMLRTPEKFAPEGLAWTSLSLVVQHMDARDLRYHNETFDAVFSSGSIEHVGTWDDIAQVASEIGRVLKPGGIASISTEYLLADSDRVGGEAGDGWPGVKLFTMERILKYILWPSKLEFVDRFKSDTTDADTYKTAWPLEKAVQGEFPEVEGVLCFQRYDFTSVHIALRKPAN